MGSWNIGRKRLHSGMYKKGGRALSTPSCEFKEEQPLALGRYLESERLPVSTTNIIRKYKFFISERNHSNRKFRAKKFTEPHSQLLTQLRVPNS